MQARTLDRPSAHQPRALRLLARRQDPGTGHLSARVQDLVSRIKEADGPAVDGLPYPPAGYRRHVLQADKEVELIAATWAPGQGTPLHGHGPSETLTKVLEGHVVEERFVPDPATEGRSFHYELVELGPGAWSHAHAGVVHRVWGRTATKTIQCTAPSNDNPLYPIDAALWPRLDEARAKALQGQ